MSTLTFTEQLTPNAPAAAKQIVYLKSDGILYKRNSAGIESPLVPPAVADGSITQSKLASNVVGNGPAFSAYLSADQASSGASERINCDVKEFDFGGCYNNTGATVILNGISVPAYSYAPNVAGIYLMGSSPLIFSASGGNGRLALLYKNGVFHRQLAADPQNIGTGAGMGNSMCLVMANGTSDYFTPWGRSLGTTPVFGSGIGATRFEGYLLRPL